MIPTTKSIESVAPVVILGMALGIMLFFDVPVPNKDLVNLILAGFLGYLSKSRNDPTPPPSDDPASRGQP